MPRMVDADCTVCDFKLRDQFVMVVPDVMYHDAGGGVQHPMSYVYVPRTSKYAEWDDRDAVVVYKKANGELVYPARNDQPTPAGCERITMKSLRAVETFEKRYGVTNEAIHFDRGSGTRRPDEQERAPRVTQEQKLARFMEAYRR